MAILVVGLILFIGVHSVRIAAPGWREALDKEAGRLAVYRGAHVLVAAVGLVLMVWGFARAATDPVIVYVPGSGLRYLTQLVMIPALILAMASGLPAGRIKRAIKHPLLIGTILWAVGHLLANGDAAGLVLFGSFLAWAVVDLVLVWNRVTAPATDAVSTTADIGAVVIGLALYAAFVFGLHAWLFGAAPL